ncbi:hypothetical protein NO1_1430 [Candidatus Termititenax aidoneus]|uniref:Uncharacterized protein n=1 Tax=Termititenax aidoneus TaxID=2218524 RepID=A0A388TCW1_TERA1|nr:hypothetical protein NO1_1430 [Candidatus Termititenax aidoneus]
MQSKIIAETKRSLANRLISPAKDIAAAQTAPDKNFDTSIVLSDYLELIQSDYVKNMLSVVVPNNNNSTRITSSLSINTLPSNQCLRAPFFIPKFNFRKLLAAKLTKPEGVFELKLKPYIVQQADGQKILRVSAVLRRGGEDVAANNDAAGLEELFQTLLQNKPPRSGKQIWQDIHDLHPVRMPNLKYFPPEIRHKLKSFLSAHTLVQSALIENFRNYLKQLEPLREIPLAIRAALALEACQNEVLNKNDYTLRVIEDLTYLADCVFNQDISAQKLALPQKTSRPLAVISEYFTLEDILQIYRQLPKDVRRPLVFISAWEPDFIPQEVKLTSKTIRNDDAQELCSLLKLDYYISDETVANFQREMTPAVESVLSILDRDTLHNGDNRYTGGIIVINTAAEVNKFITAFKQLFSLNQEHVFDRRQFHKHEQTLGRIYGKLTRRMLTHHKPLAMLSKSEQEYTEYIRNALVECLPKTEELLTKTDWKNLQAAVKALTAKAAAEQEELKKYIAAHAFLPVPTGSGYAQTEH